MTSGANPWEHDQLLPSPLCTDSLGRFMAHYQSIWGWGKEGGVSVRNDWFQINLKRVTFKTSQHIIRNIYKMPTLPCVYEDIVVPPCNPSYPTISYKAVQLTSRPVVPSNSEMTGYFQY